MQESADRNSAEGRVLEVQDWGLVPYEEALSRQRSLAEARANDLVQDVLVFVEHPPCVTLGRSATAEDLLVAEDELARRKVSVVWVERGGKATYHGPGQLVAYPVIRLEKPDLHAFLEGLLGAAEQVLRAYGLDPERRPGRPGLWVRGGKIASVGVAVRKGVTFHGIALNVNTDPVGFGLIVTCGQPGERVTSMHLELGRPVSLEDGKRTFAQAFCRNFGYASIRRPAGVDCGVVHGAGL